MVDSLPGGIGGTAPRRDPYWSTQSDQQLLDDAARIQEEIQKRQLAAEEAAAIKNSFPIKTTIYCHGDKETNWAKAAELGLKGDAARNFSYMALEVEIDVLIDETGTATATHFNGVELAKPVEI